MKKYLRASDILQEELLREIQRYIEGETLYIPKRANSRAHWGERNGSRSELRRRNEEICLKFENGVVLETLAKNYCLSLETIKKIVYQKK